MVVREAYTSGLKTQHNEVSKYTDVKIKFGICYNIFQFFIIDTFLFTSIAPFFRIFLRTFSFDVQVCLDFMQVIEKTEFPVLSLTSLKLMSRLLLKKLSI